MKFRQIVPDIIVDAAVWTMENDTPHDPVSIETETGPDGNPRQYGLLHMHDDQKRVNSGDYIVRHAEGDDGVCRLDVLSPEAFAAKYELASHARSGARPELPADSTAVDPAAAHDAAHRGKDKHKDK